LDILEVLTYAWQSTYVRVEQWKNADITTHEPSIMFFCFKIILKKTQQQQMKGNRTHDDDGI
jgi:hypothetical protein